MSLSPLRRRLFLRSLHLALAIPVGALVYAPEAFALSVRPLLQLLLFPLLALTGLWMWKGHRFRPARSSAGAAETRR